MILLTIGEFEFRGTLETARAPQTVAWLRARLPLEVALLQARWSGDAGWAPLGAVPPLAPENALHAPVPGQVLLYAGAVSEPELLLPYGECRFNWKGGELQGNHVITLANAEASLQLLGRHLLHRGAQPLRLIE